MSSTQAPDVMESLSRLVAMRGMVAARSLDGNSLDISIVRRPGKTTFVRSVSLRSEGDRGWAVEWGITGRRLLAVEEPGADSKLLEAIEDVLGFMEDEVRTRIEEPPTIRHSR
jgi:hypothetical protein